MSYFETLTPLREISHETRVLGEIIGCVIPDEKTRAQGKELWRIRNDRPKTVDQIHEAMKTIKNSRLIPNQIAHRLDEHCTQTTTKDAWLRDLFAKLLSGFAADPPSWVQLKQQLAEVVAYLEPEPRVQVPVTLVDDWITPVTRRYKKTLGRRVEDVHQETFMETALKVICNAGPWAAELEGRGEAVSWRFKAWATARSVANRRCLQIAEGTKRMREVEIPNGLAGEQATELMQFSWEVLTPQERIVLKGIYWESKTVECLAQELNVSKHSVRRLHQSALRKLQNAIGSGESEVD